MVLAFVATVKVGTAAEEFCPRLNGVPAIKLAAAEVVKGIVVPKDTDNARTTTLDLRTDFQTLLKSFIIYKK